MPVVLFRVFLSPAFLAFRSLELYKFTTFDCMTRFWPATRNFESNLRDAIWIFPSPQEHGFVDNLAFVSGVRPRRHLILEFPRQNQCEMRSLPSPRHLCRHVP